MGFALLKLEEKRKNEPDLKPTLKSRRASGIKRLKDWYRQMRLQHRIVIDPSFFEAPAVELVPPRLKAAE